MYALTDDTSALVEAFRKTCLLMFYLLLPPLLLPLLLLPLLLLPEDELRDEDDDEDEGAL
jgi:hypothetical protein